jgi:methyltransferase (TIGR00027 family)
MGRAAAHGRTDAVKFSDPVAISLLPPDARAEVDRFRANSAPLGLRVRMQRAFFAARSQMMVARTIAIDESIREATSPQVVILGAGLDGRAWRMDELRSAVVFEVDHPDSQREKRARAERLQRVAREVHWVPVDFAQQNLDEALSAAGHDPAQPTTWIWEGVVMYLALSAIEATLGVIQRRSAPGSRLIVAYFSPAMLLHLVAPLVRRLGEPIQSVFKADELRALLQEYGFAVVKDLDLAALGAALSPDIGHATKRMKHLRIATADAVRADTRDRQR